MIANHEKPRWFFYPIWVILTSLCIPITFVIVLSILRIIIGFVGDIIYVDGVRHITEDYLAMYLFIPIASLLIGVVQYMLLRRYLPRMGGWVLATIGGWILGVLLIAIPDWQHWTAAPIRMDLALILMGLVVGAGQWLLLRQRLPRAGWWIGANVGGWGLLGLITPGNALDQFTLWIVGFIPACLTAAMLAVLIQRVKPAQHNSARSSS
jgi:hypothetical protein